MKNAKKEPWRIVVGVVSLIFIVVIWVTKDIGAVYATMPTEQPIPMIVTSVVVTAVKVAAISGVFFLIKWLVSKFTQNTMLD